MKRSKLVSFFCIIAVVCAMVSVPAFSGSASAAPIDPPRVSAKSAIVIDFDTGETLFEHDSLTTRVPASMSKSLTAFIAYEEIAAGNLTLGTQLRVSPTAASISTDPNIQGSRVPLRAGTLISVDDLLHLMMLPSSNAACVVIAEHISGTQDAFADLMNDTAKSIGMTGSFNNAHGSLPNYSNAYSMAILAKVFIERHPDILRITAKSSFTLDGVSYNQTNLLIQSGAEFYAGTDGLKTGTTTEAGFCLTSTAVRNGRRIIAVVMFAENNAGRYNDSKALLNYGFAEAARRDAAKETGTMGPAGNVKVRLDGEDLEFDVQPQMISNRVMVPARAMLEAMGADVKVYLGTGGHMILAVTTEGDLIILQTGKNSIRVNDTIIEIDAPVQEVGGRMLASIRFIAEAMNKSVSWDNASRTVSIESIIE